MNQNSKVDKKRRAFLRTAVGAMALLSLGGLPLPAAIAVAASQKRMKIGHSILFRARKPVKCRISMVMAIT